MEEEICNPVSARWEKQGAEETHPGAKHGLCSIALSPSTTIHPVPHEHPSAPHEAARNLTGITGGAAGKLIQLSLAAFSALQTIVT